MAYELAWAAGLFEGEGCISKTRTGWCATLSSTDEDVVRSFHETIGCGKVLGPYQYKHNVKPYWMWYLHDKAGLRRVGERIGGLLHKRRSEQMALALAHANTPTSEGNKSKLRNSCFEPAGAV